MCLTIYLTFLSQKRLFQQHISMKTHYNLHIPHTFILSVFLLMPITIKAQYYSVNYDYQTIAAMVATYGAEAGTEGMTKQNTSNIAESYGYSEVATAGIFASKLLDRNALK